MTAFKMTVSITQLWWSEAKELTAKVRIKNDPRIEGFVDISWSPSSVHIFPSKLLPMLFIKSFLSTCLNCSAVFVLIRSPGTFTIPVYALAFLKVSQYFFTFSEIFNLCQLDRLKNLERTVIINAFSYESKLEWSTESIEVVFGISFDPYCPDKGNGSSLSPKTSNFSLQKRPQNVESICEAFGQNNNFSCAMISFLKDDFPPEEPHNFTTQNCPCLKKVEVDCLYVWVLVVEWRGCWKIWQIL